MVSKVIRVGIDLDGIIINKPPFIPKKTIEWLIQSHTNHQKKYRFPKTKLERWVRIQSHHWKLRPPLKQNLKAIKKLARSKKCEIYFISSRYRFLAGRTREWFARNFPEFDYKKVYLNLENEQPHFFKEKMIKKSKVDYYLEDDLKTIDYLKKKVNCVIIKIDRDGQIKKELFN